MKKTRLLLSSIVLSFVLLFSGCTDQTGTAQESGQSSVSANLSGNKDTGKLGVSQEDSSNGTSVFFDLSSVPAYSGQPYVVINNNQPFFTQAEITTDEFQNYSELDSLGRCGAAYVNVSPDTLPNEKRGKIGMIKPTGWHTVKYDNVDGRYLYNRCHIIAHCLTGLNAEPKNLITGTRYMNVDGMLPFESMVCDYVKETSHHVLYRVTPIFKDDNLVASGVLMEGQSVEDNEIQYCVYCYNVQPGIEIDYATGDSHMSDSDITAVSEDTSTYILNENTKKFHRPDCASVSQMNGTNKKEYTGNRQELIDAGYSACGNCKP